MHTISLHTQLSGFDGFDVGLSWYQQKLCMSPRRLFREPDATWLAHAHGQVVVQLEALHLAHPMHTHTEAALGNLASGGMIHQPFHL